MPMPLVQMSRQMLYRPIHLQKVCLVTDGDRIAQMGVAPVIHVKWTQWTDEATQTVPSGRADKGFGSSGQSR